jgi:hypothetical protein
VIDPECNSIGDRIFFCATPWKIKEDEHSIFVTYGRSNPSKLFKSMARLKFNTKIESEELNEQNVSIEVVEPILDSESIDINEKYSPSLLHEILHFELISFGSYDISFMTSHADVIDKIVLLSVTIIKLV